MDPDPLRQAGVRHRQRRQAGAGAQGITKFGKHGTHGVRHGGVAVLREQQLHRGRLSNAIDCREDSCRLRILHLDQGRSACKRLPHLPGYASPPIR